MASFTAGTSFTDGVANDVTAAKLGALITNATPTSGLIQDRTAETVVATNDTFLIGDASDSNNLKRMTVANVMKAELTGTINTTAGTIATLNSTTGTIATLNSTTATIPTLTSITKITSGTGTAAAPAISPTGDTNTGIFFPAADTVAFSDGGTESMRINSSGNVGIGTTTADSKLSVYGANTSDSGAIYTANILNTATAVSGVGSGLVFGANIATSGVTNIAAMAGIEGIKENGTTGNYASALKFTTRANGGNLTEKLRIDSAGNVGIGVASPTSKLDVDGQLQLRATGAEGGQLTLLNTGNASTGLNIDVSTADVGRIFSLRDNFSLQMGQSAGTGGIVSFYTAAAERLRIDGSGNVGIGTTSPSNKLSITNYTSAVTAGGQALEVYSDSNHRAYLTQNSAAGSQSAFLSHGARWLNTSGTYTAEKTIASFGSPAILLDNENFNGIKFLFKAGGATVSDGSVSNLMTILSSGNVGIGVSAPVNKLEVVGSFGRGAPVTKTADFSLADTENWLIVNKGSSCTVTLPAASSWTGREFTIKVITAHAVVSATAASVVPRIGGAAGTAILPATDGAWATLVSNGATWEIMCGS